MKTTSVLGVAMTLAFIVELVAQQSTGPVKQPPAPEPNREIISKLEEIVRIRTRQAESYELLMRAGKADPFGSVEIDFAEVRIRLARERGEPEAVAVELKNLVAAHERRIKRAEPIARDRLAPDALEGLRAGLLEAEIRLLKEQK